MVRRCHNGPWYAGHVGRRCSQIHVKMRSFAAIASKLRMEESRCRASAIWSATLERPLAQHHHQSRLRREGRSVRRPQDDGRLAWRANPSSPHPGSGDERLRFCSRSARPAKGLSRNSTNARPRNYHQPGSVRGGKSGSELRAKHYAREKMRRCKWLSTMVGRDNQTLPVVPVGAATRPSATAIRPPTSRRRPRTVRSKVCFPALLASDQGDVLPGADDDCGTAGICLVWQGIGLKATRACSRRPSR